MGLSLSMLSSAWNEVWEHKCFTLLRALRLRKKNDGMGNEADSLKNEGSDTKNSFDDSDQMVLGKNWGMKEEKVEACNVALDTENLSGLASSQGKSHGSLQMNKPKLQITPPATSFSPKPDGELDAAATKVQKVYRSYRTRRNLADCAVVVEELWWKALDFASLDRYSISFFNAEKPETAASRWSRAKKRVAKVGKGLSKDEKAQKLALQHWLEAIDPRHRYGRNLHFYYDVWFASKSNQHFFYWLDIGDGKELNLEKCPRAALQRQCIKYLGPKEREAYEVIVENGKLIYKQSRMPVTTEGDSKWIFVLSTSRALYVGQKKKGVFQHSSFLSGAATTAAGRLIAHDGILEAIWPYSGHYRPTKDNFKEFISYLQENHVDLTNVKLCAVDGESFSYTTADENSIEEETKSRTTSALLTNEPDDFEPSKEDRDHEELEAPATLAMEEQAFSLPNRLSCKWSSGVGPRIGCVRDYPADLRSQALEQVNLSPKDMPKYGASNAPIPSPRPSPTIRVSPRLAYMGLPTPRPSKINDSNPVQFLNGESHVHGYGSGN